jgi:hypothetical protein
MAESKQSFACEFCGKVLTGMGNLKRHIKTSKLCLQERGIYSATESCADCEYGTTSKFHLLQHFESCKLRKARLLKEKSDNEARIKEDNIRLQLWNDIIRQQFEDVERQFLRSQIANNNQSKTIMDEKIFEILKAREAKTDVQVQEIETDTQTIKTSGKGISQIEAETKRETNDSKEDQPVPGQTVTNAVLNGFIYVIKEREFIKTDENVFKVGRTTRVVNRRLDQYPKGSRPYYFEEVKNCVETERLIIARLKSFSNYFIHRTDIGAEYFEGNSQFIISAVKSVTCEINPDHLRFAKH